ncbi:MAG: Ferredoxin-dependent glutamate synthase (EC [uncultured Paraburkholderia sp.]|nr:MAG: Ferredoxin-dependent glutamate synthase (EC [uncultured Paraburkholderia sp.]CAH2919144.1 MAG: Ferredoxin-dependent glutamate synthase (EC [uncultured Paraburkholderia sp.]
MITAFDITKALAIGTDWVNAARGFMFAVAAFRRRLVTRGAARPAWRRRIRCVSVRSSCRTSQTASSAFITTRCMR